MLGAACGVSVVAAIASRTGCACRCVRDDPVPPEAECGGASIPQETLRPAKVLDRSKVANEFFTTRSCLVARCSVRQLKIFSDLRKHRSKANHAFNVASHEQLIVALAG